ncbi:Scr1 family TA system antitoxin-like transcriptional regulator [Glycomyces salinus]|uniref:Scr1 family TA system antitoxin-like transcriptional regulator n=1 Tax=Glycomyces salinus TaxID=980294 RepID=UPI0018EC0F5D|nr:Scr1 family TA system antitoxin-like transcriptional regulator [Glycomyces salinus]
MADRTFLRIQLGRRLAELRRQAGRTATDAIREGVVRSKAQMSRLENGHRVQLTLANIAALCELYGVTGQGKYVIQQMYLKAEADQEWWEPYSEVMFRNISLLFSLERYADEILIFDTLVNGLFQTEGLVRRIHSAEEPPTRERLVELRMKRQKDFWACDPLPKVQLMMPEFTLASGCDQEQLDWLVELDERPGISIRYLPVSAGPLHRLLGPFTVLRFKNNDPDVVYTESISGARYEDREAAVKAHLDTFTSHIEEQTRPVKEYRNGT